MTEGGCRRGSSKVERPLFVGAKGRRPLDFGRVKCYTLCDFSSDLTDESRPFDREQLLREPNVGSLAATDAGALRHCMTQLQANMASVLIGKPETIKLAVVALLAEGHILIEDVPGVGKTLLAKALAKSLDCSFRRIQFTPDLLPSDILGSSVFSAPTSDFVFKPGPIFAHVVLADEINRTTPRTQSALLEAMSDRQVSVDGQTYVLPHPFILLATENPYEFEGTYALPENQLDRFMMRLQIGYPAREDELQILTSHRHGEPVDDLRPVVTADQVLALQRAVREVAVDHAVSGYILDIVEASRSGEALQVGVSPRGALTLYRGAQALALVEGRDYVVPDDVKRLAVEVLAHRVVGKSFLQDGDFAAAEAAIRAILAEVAVPE